MERKIMGFFKEFKEFALKGSVMDMAIGIVIFLVTYILPTFVNLFEGMALELPLPTKILMSITKAFQNIWVIIGIVVGLVLLSAF